MKVIFATQNKGKIIEMRDLLADLPIEVVSAAEVGITEEIEEDGKTFEENALKKANYVSNKSKHWAIADDSGLCIRALNGAPGVFSARWAGQAVAHDRLADYTLQKMSALPPNKRQAKFVSVVALVSPAGKSWIFQGEVTGSIALETRGQPRPKLPYDLIFIPDGHQKTFAEMSDFEKNSLSHRGLAFKKLKKFLKTLL